MDKNIISYAAGFFDGDGCITTSGNTGFRITLSNTDKRVLEFFQNNFGGSINNQHLPQNPKHNIAWKWVQAKRADVLSTLVLFEPFLISKKEQAQIAIQYLQKYDIEMKTNRKISEQERSDFLIAKKKIRSLKTDKHYAR
jgi:hypothetical protein